MLWIGEIGGGLTTSASDQDPPLIQAVDLGTKNTMLLGSRCGVIMVQTSRSVFHKYFRPEMRPFEEVGRELHLKGRWGCCFHCCVEQAVLRCKTSQKDRF